MKLIETQRVSVLRQFTDDGELTCAQLVAATRINRSSVTTVLQSLRKDLCIKFRSVIGRSGNATHVYSRGENFSAALKDDSTGYAPEKDYAKVSPPKQSWLSGLGVL